MANVNFKNIYKVYSNGAKAVNDFSMYIEDKEFIVLVGPSGCGKSTLLRMLAGLEEISAGELKIDGEVVNDVECKERDTAMVFQNYALYPHMTVAENMAFPLKMMKQTKREKAEFAAEVDKMYPTSLRNKLLRRRHIDKLRHEKMMEKVLETAKILDLHEYLAKKPGAMSGGQRQRVALGRAMVRRPKVFLLDEPLSNLDAKLRTQMRSEITKLHKRLQTTFVYVTHDQTEAMTMGDRIVVMKKGVVQQIDTPMNLFDYPENLFVAGFIGTPAMNFFDAVVTDNGDVATVTFANDQKLTCPFAAVRKMGRNYFGKSVKMGVRPEHFLLSDDGVECVVVSREVLGSETLLYCDFDIEKATNFENSAYGFIVKVAGNVPYNSGDRIRVTIDFPKMHFFDTEGEHCVNSRLVRQNHPDVTVNNGKLLVGTQEMILPPALAKLEDGEYRMLLPADAIEVGEGYPAEVCECEKIGNEYLIRFEIGGVSLFARLNREVSGSILVRFKLHCVDFYRSDEKIWSALETQNSLPITLKKIELTAEEKNAIVLPVKEKQRELTKQYKEQKKSLKKNGANKLMLIDLEERYHKSMDETSSTDFRKFDIDLVFGSVVLKCPLVTAKRILSASDRKLFDVPMELHFNENNLIEGTSFTATVLETFDYGKEKYARCKCNDAEIILPYRGNNSISFDIDLLTANVYDPRVEIKIS